MTAQEIAVAVLFAYHPTGAVNADAFREDEGVEDPIQAAELLRESVRDDFPDAIFSIGANERARIITGARRMREWGLTNPEEEAP